MDKIIIKGFSFTLVIVFLVMIFTSSSGYYEYELNKKTTLTNEAIEKFEQDLKDGKNIDIDDYVVKDDKNYDNRISKMGNNISNKIDNIMSAGINYLFKYIEKSIKIDK